MALFPKIQSPCPYKGDLSEIMDGDQCRLCKRQVVDLTAMTDAERISLLSGCAEEICVSYRLPVRVALAATIALGAAAAPMAAAAQENTQVVEVVVTGGAIKDRGKVEYVHHPDAADAAVAELPVTYEPARDAAPTKATADRAAPPPASVKRPG
jgi:hypothetical protein